MGKKKRSVKIAPLAVESSEIETFAQFDIAQNRRRIKIHAPEGLFFRDSYGEEGDSKLLNVVLNIDENKKHTASVDVDSNQWWFDEDYIVNLRETYPCLVNSFLDWYDDLIPHSRNMGLVISPKLIPGAEYEITLPQPVMGGGV